jgi:hypothetical protein
VGCLRGMGVPPMGAFGVWRGMWLDGATAALVHGANLYYKDPRFTLFFRFAPSPVYGRGLDSEEERLLPTRIKGEGG